MIIAINKRTVSKTITSGEKVNGEKQPWVLQGSHLPSFKKKSCSSLHVWQVSPSSQSKQPVRLQGSHLPSCKKKSCSSLHVWQISFFKK